MPETKATPPGRGVRRLRLQRRLHRRQVRHEFRIVVPDLLHDDVGGTVKFHLRAGKENKNRYYLVLASFSGTEPGFPLPGGICVLPLNWDTLSQYVMTYLNTLMFHYFLGTLDQDGKGLAVLHMPGIPGLAWNTMHFAYCCNNPFDFVSNPFAVDLVD